MANPAQRIRNQYVGATVVERGRNFIRHQLVSGRIAADTTIGPLHVQGTSTEINTAWQPVTGAWQYQITAADYQASARNVLNAGDAIEYRHTTSQEWVTFQPLSLNWVNQNNSRQQIAITQAVTATVNDDTLLWTNGLGNGRHFSYRADTASLQKLIKIDSSVNLPTPTVQGTIWLEAEFQIKNSAGIELFLDGVQWARANNARVTTAERIEFRQTATGTVLWWMDYARVWDSGGNESMGQLQVRRSGPSYFITVRIPKTWIDSAVFPLYIDPTLDISVAASTDDGVEVGNGTVTLNGINVRLNVNTSWGAFRFVNVTVPQGATIDVAYINIQRAAQDTPNVGIYAQDADTTSTLTTTSNDISNRPRTTANVTWNATLGGATDSRHNSPEIKTVIQEVVDRAGWASGNSMVVVLDCLGGDIGIRAYDNGASTAASLHIEYTVAGGATYTATGAATLGTFTAAGAATHEAPTYSATGTATIPVLSAAGAATSTAPIYSATGSGALAALTATGAATHSAPVYSASGTPVLPALTTIGSATHTAPVFTSTGAATLPALSAYGTDIETVGATPIGGLFLTLTRLAVEEQFFSASGSPTLAALSASGAATHTAPVYAATAATILPSLSATGSAAFDAGTFTAASAVTLPALTGSGTAAFDAGIFTGTGTIVLPALAATGGASFDAGTFTATGATALPVLDITGTAGHTAPAFTASGTATLGALSASGAAAFATDSFYASGAAQLPTLSATGNATFDAGTFSGSGTAALPALTGSGVADHNAPAFAASGSAALPALIGDGSASFVMTAHNATGGATLPLLGANGTASYVAPIRTATGALVLAVLTAAGIAENTPSLSTGSGAIALPMLLASGLAAYADTGAQVIYNAVVEINLLASAEVEMTMLVGATVDVL